MTVSRRVLLQASAVLAAGSSARAAEAPADLKVHTVLLFKKQPTQTLGEFMRWYEELHAPGFVKLAKPLIARYCRNFVLSWRRQDPGFDAMVEFGYASVENQQEAARITLSPAGPPLLGVGLRTVGETKAPPGAAGPQGASRSYPNNFPITETLLAGSPRDHNPAPAFKTMLILKRKGAGPYTAFADAARAFGATLAQKAAKDAARMTLDVVETPAEGTDERPFDGVISIWPKRGIRLPDSYDTPASLDVASILDVESHESIVGV